MPQGSQVFVRDQARALRAAGADVTLLCYGSGVGPDPPDLPLVRIPRALSPRGVAAGPSPMKPVSDVALVAALVRAQRRQRFDAVLAHNGEAALVALVARAWTGTPCIYVVHTLLGVELSAYGPRLLAAPLDAAGRAVDALAARGADAVQALCSHAATVLRGLARGPVAVIPPGLDPRSDPSPEEIAVACARHGFAPGRYALYAGNLDGYQDLDEVREAARLLPGIPFAVATHAAPPRNAEGLVYARCGDVDEVRALTFGAGVTVLARRRPGGFPIKLLNYMEARRPIVARAEVADGLTHEHSAWLLGPDDGAPALAGAVRGLLDDRERAARMGQEARRVLERRHAWPALAGETLALARRAARRRRDR